MFCRVCHFYAMTDVEVMSMPIYRFWLMNSNANRLMAESDLRKLTLAIYSQGGEEAEEYRATLIKEIGMVSKSEDKLDREGFESLRSLL